MRNAVTTEVYRALKSRALTTGAEVRQEHPGGELDHAWCADLAHDAAEEAWSELGVSDGAMQRAYSLLAVKAEKWVREGWDSVSFNVE